MVPISTFEKRDELRRILQSKYFARGEKKTRFLEFVTEQTLLGNAEKLNEYLIGVEIYGRGVDFNPQEDPIVRVQAHQIRRSLEKYYQAEGKDSSLRVSLPAGHYVPVFTKADAGDRSERRDATPAPGIQRTSSLRRIGLAALVLSTGLFASLWLRERSRVNQLSEARLHGAPLAESLEWFWKPFLRPAPPPLVVVPNHPMLRAAHDGDSRQLLARGHLIDKDTLVEFRDTIHFRELNGFYFVPTTTDFTGLGEALGLLNLFQLFYGANQPIRLKPSRLVDFQELKAGNAILLGGNQAWSGRVFVYPEGFRFSRGVIWNKNPRPGERAVYKPEFDPVTNNLSRDYALILMLPNERREERILLIYGIYTQGSQAAIEYVTNSERMAELRRKLMSLAPESKAPPPLFELLLETTVENAVPGRTSLVSFRIIPEGATFTTG
jgi:hypothetical protein